jgi:hypothetical protein
MNLKRLILFFAIANISIITLGQDFSIGAKIGYGNSIYKRQSDGEKTPKYFTQKYGFSVEFSPYYSKFFILSGAEFEINELGNRMMIPLSLRIIIGQDFRFFIEGGGYYNISLKNKSEKYIQMNDIGLKAGIGFQYKINRNWLIETAFIGKYGFTAHLEEEIVLPGNQIDFEKYTLMFHQIELSLKYRF